MVHVEKDYQYGILKQKEVLPYLRQYFSADIQEQPNKWAKHDFSDSKALYELKSRSFKKNTFPTTLMTCNKVDVVNKDKTLYFLFNFTDELCFIQYDENEFSSFEKKPFSRINQASDMKDHYFIPIERLKTIQQYV